MEPRARQVRRTRAEQEEEACGGEDERDHEKRPDPCVGDQAQRRLALSSVPLEHDEHQALRPTLLGREPEEAHEAHAAEIVLAQPNQSVPDAKTRLSLPPHREATQDRVAASDRRGHDERGEPPAAEDRSGRQSEAGAPDEDDEQRQDAMDGSRSGRRGHGFRRVPGVAPLSRQSTSVVRARRTTE
jgi:hypothetical protein